MTGDPAAGLATGEVAQPVVQGPPPGLHRAMPPDPPPLLPAGPPLLRFGLIADVQYADTFDSANFSKTVTRYFRHSLAATEAAVRCWLAALEDTASQRLRMLEDNQSASGGGSAWEGPPDPAGGSFAFVANLGDLVDLAVGSKVIKCRFQSKHMLKDTYDYSCFKARLD